jgi:hypothetical protein
VYLAISNIGPSSVPTRIRSGSEISKQRAVAKELEDDGGGGLLSDMSKMTSKDI